MSEATEIPGWRRLPIRRQEVKMNLIDEYDNPHLDEIGEYHGEAVWLDEPCPKCGSAATHFEQYYSTTGELVEGCTGCGWETF